MEWEVHRYSMQSWPPFMVCMIQVLGESHHSPLYILVSRITTPSYHFCRILHFIAKDVVVSDRWLIAYLQLRYNRKQCTSYFTEVIVTGSLLSVLIVYPQNQRPGCSLLILRPRKADDWGPIGPCSAARNDASPVLTSSKRIYNGNWHEDQCLHPRFKMLLTAQSLAGPSTLQNLKHLERCESLHLSPPWLRHTGARLALCKNDSCVPAPHVRKSLSNTIQNTVLNNNFPVSMWYSKAIFFH